jgi:hypothetical protein
MAVRELIKAVKRFRRRLYSQLFCNSRFEKKKTVSQIFCRHLCFQIKQCLRKTKNEIHLSTKGNGMIWSFVFSILEFFASIFILTRRCFYVGVLYIHFHEMIQIEQKITFVRIVKNYFVIKKITGGFVRSYDTRK